MSCQACTWDSTTVQFDGDRAEVSCKTSDRSNEKLLVRDPDLKKCSYYSSPQIMSCLGMENLKRTLQNLELCILSIKFL